MVERTMVGEDEVTVTSGLHAQAERAKKQKEKRKCPPPEYAYNFLPAIVNQHQHTKHSPPVPPAGVPQDASFEPCLLTYMSSFVVTVKRQPYKN